MNLHLHGPGDTVPNVTLQISGSKSESNRLLVLQAHFPQLQIGNLSDADDVLAMQEGLRSVSERIDVHHAGTTMRFLTAFFAFKKGREILLTGSKRMQERPIGILVDALNSLGADITYGKKTGYPPLHIRGAESRGSTVRLPANVSSQYISALLLSAPVMPSGLRISLEGKITSRPYLMMTVNLMRQIGIDVRFHENLLDVKPAGTIEAREVLVESDWSSASYFFSILSMCQPGTKLELRSFREDSLQGDKVLMDIYEKLGVRSEITDNKLVLTNAGKRINRPLEWDLADAPDIAQTIAVSCLGLDLPCKLTGLHTLKIKETDRLAALKTELEKLGAKVKITSDTLELVPARKIRRNISIETYNDHRMAMAFAPLAMRTPLIIEDAGVVSKSYPQFWDDLKLLKFTFTRA